MAKKSARKPDKKAKKKPGKPAKAGAGKKSPKAAATSAKKKSATGDSKKGKKKGDKQTDKKAQKQAQKKADKADALAPRPIATGRGPTPLEIGQDLVAMVRAGVPEEQIWDKWFSPKFVSIEGGQMNMGWHGRKAVKSKVDWWRSAHKVHSVEADGPFIGATGFGVLFTIDAEEIATGKRFIGDELAFYSVLNGKVIQEEFMGEPMAAPDTNSEPTAESTPTEASA